MEYDSILKASSALLIAWKDPEKVAAHLYEIVEDNLEGEESTIESSSQYVIDIITYINECDYEYADQIAIQYLQLITESYLK